MRIYCDANPTASLTYCSLSVGTIPTEFNNLTELELITLSNTSVSGPIPEALCDDLKDVELACVSIGGVVEPVCTDVDIKNFSCAASSLCGCSCEPCGIGTAG